MKFKYRALTLGCFAAMGLASTAQAVQVAGDLLEVYGNLYPQYQSTSFGDSPIGSGNSNMTKGLATPVAATAVTAGAIGKNQINWVNSYVGFKGKKTFGEVTAGYDLQGVLSKNVESGFSLFNDTRDAYVYLGHANLGTLNVGQMDTIYKAYGDQVRMLGVSSSNFVSTSGIVSGVGWKSATKDTSTTTYATAGAVTTPTTLTTGVAGTSSFNTRIGGQLLYQTPVWSGVQAGFSYRADPSKTATQNQYLTSMGVKWSNGTYYVGLGQETHNDYRTFSGTDVVEKSSTILNRNPHSKDTATRLSVGYTAGPLKLAADVSSLKYTEDAVTKGKFTEYSTTAWQVSGEYELTPQWVIGANYAQGAAGSCSLLGGAACSTAGQGGSLLSLGGRYNYDKNIGLFAIYGLNTANNSATFASGATGAKVTNMAVGVQVKF